MAESENQESRFLAALLETCIWLEKLDYPMSRLRDLIAGSGAVAAAKRALSSANWWDGLVELFARGETKRSLEALVLSPEFCSLFTERERAEARTRLDDCQAGLQTEGEEILESARPGRSPASSGRPATVDARRYSNLNPHQRIEQQERDLRSGLPLAATSWDRTHLEECTACAQAHPMVVKAYHDFDSDIVNKLEDLLEVLKVCLDYSYHKVDLLLERRYLLPKQVEESDWWKVDGEDTNEGLFFDLCNDAENDLPPLLEHRAAMVAAHVGDFISRYASTIERRGDEDQLIQWREGAGPVVVVDFVRRLDQDQFLRLLVADQCYRVNPGYSRVDVLTVWSDEEMQSVEGVLEMKPFPPPMEWGRYARSFDFGYFMDWVKHGALWRNPECKGVPCVQPEMRTAPSATAGDQNSRVRRRKKPSREERRNQLEESLRQAMGEKVYSGLIPEARPSALQAEYLFLHEDSPEPFDIVFSLSRAFEIQLRNGWLKGFADYLLEKGVREYPTDAEYKTLLFKGKFQEEHLTLEKMEKVVAMKSPHLDEYCARCCGASQKVRAALKRIIDFRNTAAHKGCLSLELARQVRKDWLGQSRPGEGIFQVLLSPGSPRS